MTYSQASMFPELPPIGRPDVLSWLKPLMTRATMMVALRSNDRFFTTRQLCAQLLKDKRIHALLVTDGSEDQRMCLRCWLPSQVAEYLRHEMNKDDNTRIYACLPTGKRHGKWKFFEHLSYEEVQLHFRQMSAGSQAYASKAEWDAECLRQMELRLEECPTIVVGDVREAVNQALARKRAEG